MSTSIGVVKEFWGQVAFANSRIASEKADTFDKVREALLDDRLTELQSYVAQAAATDNADAAFVVGDYDDFWDALEQAGWRITQWEASYYWAAKHTVTGEELTLIEGDVQRGNTMPKEA